MRIIHRIMAISRDSKVINGRPIGITRQTMGIIINGGVIDFRNTETMCQNTEVTIKGEETDCKDMKIIRPNMEIG